MQASSKPSLATQKVGSPLTQPRNEILAMPSITAHHLRHWLFLLITTLSPLALAGFEISVPKEVELGSTFDFTTKGDIEKSSFLTIVPPTAEDGVYENYTYIYEPRTYQLEAPTKAGEWELRLMGPNSPYPTLWRQSITVVPSEVELTAPENVAAGAKVEVQWSGPNNPEDYIAIGDVASDGRAYITYAYTSQGSPLTVTAPEQPGNYLVKYFIGKSNFVLASKPLQVGAVSASVEVPASVAAGSRFEVRWQGPNNENDYVTIVAAGAPEKTWLDYAYTKKGNPLQLPAPDKPGNYEVRYVTGGTNTTLAASPITVSAVNASIKVPANVAAGSRFEVQWQGPNNENDYVTIVAAGAPEKTWLDYAYTKKGNPLPLPAPDKPGKYEVRYVTGGDNLTLASTPITVGEVSASLNAPAAAEAGTFTEIKWQGPNNPQDYITIVPVGAEEVSWDNYTYTAQGNPLKLRMPNKAGDYEIRYAMGRSYKTLATTPIKVTPATLKPGSLQVTLSEKAKAATWSQRAVEVILDASGSMLQRIDGKPRMTIARETLQQLVQNTIPQGTPFALRVFGQTVNACDTQLMQSLAPVSNAAIANVLAKVEARDGAKTPIAESLAAVPKDLAGATGEKLVILLTDGEETCSGDPAATIADLVAKGINVRVNIVGFAINDTELEKTFKRWAEIGGGAYYSAANANALATELQKSTRVGFELLDAEGNIITHGNVGDAPMVVLAGKYQLRLKGLNEKPREITIEPASETIIAW